MKDQVVYFTYGCTKKPIQLDRSRAMVRRYFLHSACVTGSLILLESLTLPVNDLAGGQACDSI
jgi:hypothetical protein